jgi:hypothetical protein
VTDDTQTTENAAAIDLSGQAERTRLLALLFADYAETTQSGKAVIAGVFDQVMFQPGVPASFYLYVRTVQSIPEIVTITILNPTGVSLGDMTLKPPDGFVPTTTPFYSQVTARIALPVTEAGLYWFDVTCNGERLGLVPLQIVALPETGDGTATK